EVFAQYLHNPAIRREMVINGNDGFLKRAILYLEHISQAIGIGFIGTEETEILLLVIARKDIPHLFAQYSRILIIHCRGFFDFGGILRKVRQIQIDQQPSSVGMWIGSHSPITCRSQCSKLRKKPSLLIKKLFWLVT